MRNALVLFLIVAAATAMPNVADNTAWFGTPAPPAMSDPRRPVMQYDDVFAPLPARFAHRHGKFDERLDAAALKAEQEKIVSFSLESLGAGDTLTQMIQSGTFYHSSGDVIESVPAEGLERAARFHAFFIEQADRAAESSIAAGKGSPFQSKATACP